jgi:hypothetical protein
MKLIYFTKYYGWLYIHSTLLWRNLNSLLFFITLPNFQLEINFKHSKNVLAYIINIINLVRPITVVSEIKTIFYYYKLFLIML